MIFLAGNILEPLTSTVTVTSAAAGKPATRLYNRDKSDQWQGTSAAQQDIDIDQGTSPASVSHLGLVNAALTANIEVYSGATFPPANLRATVLFAPDLLSALGATFTDRYWRLRLLAGSAAPAIGEALLGLGRTLPDPSLTQTTRKRVRNVDRDESPGGYSWRVWKGPARRGWRLGWGALAAANVDLIETLDGEASDSAKNLLMQDPHLILRWIELMGTEISADPVAGAAAPTAAAYWSVSMDVLEAL